MKHCSNCGSIIQETMQFCPNCGYKIVKQDNQEIEESHKLSETINTINQKIAVSNNQIPIVKRAWYAAGIFIIIILLTFQKWSPIAGNWGLMAFSVFFLIAALSKSLRLDSSEK